MANFFVTLWTRIKIDWIEWRAYTQSIWNIKRDKKAINRAIERARIKNSSDGRTYYILKNVFGGFDEVNSNDLRNLRRRRVKYFPRYQDYNVMIRECFAIVTSNEVVRNNYVETVQNINNQKQ